MINQRAFIFIGNSGCGKGTQARLLQEKMEQKQMSVLHLELGGEFRDFWETSGYTAARAANLVKTGKLQPEFLATHIWSHMLIKYFDETKHLIADGVPRRVREAQVLDGALKFYGIERPIIFYLNISRETARERMLSRTRDDDKVSMIEERLDWFEQDVMKTIEFLKNDPYYEFCEINGEQSVEEIHQEVMGRANI